jgi:hypothetical protein
MRLTMDTQAPSPSSLQAPKPPSPCSCTAHVQRLRRERLLTLAALIAWMAGTSVWTSQAQGPRTIDERVADLEKRVIGAGGSDGITRFTAPFQVTDRNGRPLLQVTGEADGQIDMVVGNAEGGHVFLGVGRSRAGFVGAATPNGNIGAALGAHAGKPMGMRVFAADGATVLGSLSLDEQQRGRLQVGDINAGSVEAGVGASGAGFLSVDRPDGSIGALIGQYRKSAMAVSVMGAGDNPAATMFGDALGGNVRVMSPQGTPVGGLFSEEEGGGLVLTGPAGGSSVVDLGVRDSGGSVRVFSVGGSSTRAALEADANFGYVSTYAPDGQPGFTVKSTASGGGYWQLLSNGTTMIEAGVADGVGTVRVGPNMSCAAGSLALPCKIVGRK